MSTWLTGKYAAHYEIAKPEQKKKAKSARLGRRVYARATRYVMTTDRKKTNPCDALTVNKELALLRRDDPRFLFTEINEYYAADGTLITRNTQEVTGQLSRSGRYIASDRLPIPAEAPAGRYRIVSKLILTRKGSKKMFLLAKSNMSFEIVSQR